MICFGMAITPEIPRTDIIGSHSAWERIVGSGIVQNVSPPVGGKCRIELDILGHQDMAGSISAYKAIVQTDKQCDAIPGDTLMISGNARRMLLRPLHGQGFTEYLLRKGITITIYPDSMSLKGRPEGIAWHHILAYHYRQAWANTMLSYVSGDAGKFLVSLCLGYRIVESDLKKSFQRSGAMHILAISGLHVGIAAGIFRWIATRIFPKNPWGRLTTSLISQIALWAFVGISGSSEPAVRAAIMLTVWDWGKLIHRGTHWAQLVSLSAMIQLLLDPSAIFQAGFQFSYAAVVSILLFSPWIRLATRLLPSLFQWPGGILLVSLAAQLGVGGLTIYHFGQFPLLFLLTNLIALPAATFFLISGWMFLITIWIMPVFASWIASPLEYSLLLFLKVIRILSEWTPESAAQIYFDINGLILFYSFLAALIFWLYQRSNWLLFTVFVLLQSCIVVFIRKNDQVYHSPSVSIYASNREKIGAISYGDTTYIIGSLLDEMKLPYEVFSQLTFHRASNWIHLPDDNYSFRDHLGNQVVMITGPLPDSLKMERRTILIPWSRLPADMPLPSWVCECEELIVPDNDREDWRDRIAQCVKAPCMRSVGNVGHFCTVFENQLP